MGDLIVLCRGHLCPECKTFWKHRELKPQVGFRCNNGLVLMPCPTCSGNGGGGNKFPTRKKEEAA